MRRPVGVKGIFVFCETKVSSGRVAAVAMLPYALSQIQSDGQFLLGNIPALLRHSGANLLHCRSAFISCASEHVDNLGAYTASRPETGLLPRKHLAQAMRGWRVTACPRLSNP